MTMHIIKKPRPPGGVGASVSNTGLAATSHMRNYGRKVERAGEGREEMGHSFWLPGLNHLGSEVGLKT